MKKHFHSFLFLSSGFSLIELMIVITIIGILSMFAIPSYQHYTQRARFAEVIAVTEPFKIAIALALQEGVPLTELKTGSHGIPAAPPTSKNVANVTVKAGVITASASKMAGSATYILKPSPEGDEWTVSGTCIDMGLCNV